ncbi:MAG: hypothetical protein AABX61_03055 [Nanoarchaeota archaeon]
MEYWHNLITNKSWEILKEIKREFDFILIGGWATYIYTKSLKSKDIDIIVDFDNLNIIRKKYNLIKNDNLKKYEIKIEEIDIDIYVKYFSKLPLPMEEIEKNINFIGGFKLVKPEILLILKQAAEKNRENSEKGEKDRIDIMGLLVNLDIDFNLYKKLIKEYKLDDYRSILIKIITGFRDLERLNLNVKNYKKIKLKLIKNLK